MYCMYVCICTVCMYVLYVYVLYVCTVCMYVCICTVCMYVCMYALYEGDSVVNNQRQCACMILPEMGIG